MSGHAVRTGRTVPAPASDGAVLMSGAALASDPSPGRCSPGFVQGCASKFPVCGKVRFASVAGPPPSVRGRLAAACIMPGPVRIPRVHLLGVFDRAVAVRDAVFPGCQGVCRSVARLLVRRPGDLRARDHEPAGRWASVEADVRARALSCRWPEGGRCSGRGVVSPSRAADRRMSGCAREAPQEAICEEARCQERSAHRSSRS